MKIHKIIKVIESQQIFCRPESQINLNYKHCNMPRKDIQHNFIFLCKYLKNLFIKSLKLRLKCFLCDKT